MSKDGSSQGDPWTLFAKRNLLKHPSSLHESVKIVNVVDVVCRTIVVYALINYLNSVYVEKKID